MYWSRFGFDFKKFRNSVIRECQECPEFEKGYARAEITEGQRRGAQEEVLECSQIFAALTKQDDLQKLVTLLLVTSIVRERTYHAGYISVVWKTAPVT